MLKKAFVAVVFLCISSMVVFADFTFPSPNGFVNDFENIIDDSAQNELESKLVALRDSYGVEVVVVTTNNFNDDTIEGFANDLYDLWKINSNGLLFIVSKEQREVRIEVGYDQEAVFTDARTGTILDQFVVPQLAEDDFTGGISAGVDQIITIISGNTEIVDSYDNTEKADIWDMVFGFGCFGGIIIVEWLARSRSWWQGGVLGLIGGAILGYYIDGLSSAVIFAFGFALAGLIIDLILSKLGIANRAAGRPWLIMSNSGRSGGRSFGGFSGGGRGSGGGGSSRSF